MFVRGPFSLFSLFLKLPGRGAQSDRQAQEPRNCRRGRRPPPTARQRWRGGTRYEEAPTLPTLFKALAWLVPLTGGRSPPLLRWTSVTLRPPLRRGGVSKAGWRTRGRCRTRWWPASTGGGADHRYDEIAPRYELRAWRALSEGSKFAIFRDLGPRIVNQL